MQPLLSIVIPTKNRYYYLKELMVAFATFNSTIIEIIIQDNSDDNTDFLSFIDQLNDNRVKYFHKEGWLSVCDNCDLGIKNATGEYISMIGDDDGFLPTIIDIVSYMKQHDIDAVVSPKPHYIWPDVVQKVWGNKNTGVVTIENYTGTIKEINTDSILKSVIAKGGTQIMDLPRVYHMVIKATCLKNLYQTCQTYFPGPSPDMANAIGLSKFVKKSFYIDIPAIITGNGYQSTGGEGARHQHHGRIEDKLFLPKNTKENWDKNIPLFWSGPTIYAESVAKALIAIDEKKSYQKLNFSYLYAYCFIFEPKYFSEIFESTKKTLKKHPLRIINILFWGSCVFFRRSFVFFKNFAYHFIQKNDNQSQISNLRTIKECIEALDNVVDSKKYIS